MCKPRADAASSRPTSSASCPSRSASAPCGTDARLQCRVPFHFRLAAVPWAVMCVVLVILASVILNRQRGSRVARLFCLMIFLVAGWFLGFAAMLSTTSASLAAMFGRLAIASVAFLPAAVYDFTATSIRTYVRHRAIVLGAWLAATMFAFLILATDFIIAGTRQFPWGSYPAAG